MASGMKGTGWVRGPKLTAELFRASAAHVESAATANLPDQFCAARDPWITDQGSTEACTAFMGVGAIYQLTGLKCSPWIPWWAARLFDAPGQPLQNVGCSTDAFLTALRDHGACPWDDLPSLGMFENPPAVPGLLTAQKHKLDIQPIYAMGDDAENAFRLSFTQGAVGTLVVNVDDAYDHPDSNGYVGPESGTSRGQHAVEVDPCYKTDATGVRWYRSPGSWGDIVRWLHQSRIRTAPFLGFASKVTSV